MTSEAEPTMDEAVALIVAELGGEVIEDTELPAKWAILRGHRVEVMANHGHGRYTVRHVGGREEDVYQDHLYWLTGYRTGSEI